MICCFKDLKVEGDLDTRDVNLDVMLRISVDRLCLPIMFMLITLKKDLNIEI